MKILIVGNDLNSYMAARYMKLGDNELDIYLSDDNNIKFDGCTLTGIKPENVPELLDFAKYNGIDFTVVFSPVAIMNGIANSFKENNLQIFAPVSQAVGITFFNSIEKKILYKLKIPSPRFGIFDRENIATEYVRNIKYPIRIKNDFTLFEKNERKCNNYKEAKNYLQKIFENGEKKTIIENCLPDEPFNIYFICDGFNAFPLVSVKYKHFGEYSIFSSPCENASENLIINILNTAIYPLLDDINKYSESYKGILGLKICARGSKYLVSEIYTGFSGYDFTIFLTMLDENLTKILQDCANGCLAEERHGINLKPGATYSVAVTNKYIINTDNTDEDILIVEDEKNTVFTALGATANSAKTKLKENIRFCTDKEFFKDFDKKSDYEVIRV